ncbi:MAG: RNA polymerase sigma factor [Alphaproteobacteria bacterium]
MLIFSRSASGISSVPQVLSERQACHAPAVEITRDRQIMVHSTSGEDAAEISRTLVSLLPRLRRFGTSLSGSLDRADDLVQDACERALNRVDQFTPGTRLDSWMFAIMHSIWKNRLRADAVRGGGGNVDADQLVDERAHSEAEARAELSLLDRLILALPEEQRLALMLVSVEGHSYKEAATLLGVPIGTVMSRLSRARGALATAAAEGAQAEARQ